jgi:hypothetical protein
MQEKGGRSQSDAEKRGGTSAQVPPPGSRVRPTAGEGAGRGSGAGRTYGPEWGSGPQPTADGRPPQPAADAAARPASSRATGMRNGEQET